MGDLIHFRTPAGQILGMTLPVHEAIEHQWRTGELQRVQEDGSPWQGAGSLPGDPAPDDDGLAHEGTAPSRPRANAHVSKWQRYAVALRACTEDQAAEMSRDELIKLTTPPEMEPPEV